MRMRPGARLGGRYLLDDRIATGGVGEVWKAVDEATGGWVAIKVLRDRHVGDAGFRERFRAEAHHTAALAHPGLAEVFDYVEDGSLAYLVMEFLAGRPLSVLLRGGRELGSRLTLGIVGQVAVTLQAAHKAGVVHRDIKPDNLIVGYDGQVKVTDFGIARGADMATLTQPGVVLGTAVYMSPEQAEARRVTAATDIYSLGVVCYECLAGRVPFLGSTPVEIAFGHVRELPPSLPAYVPRALRDLVSQCLAKDPGQRPSSMAEVAEVAYSIAQTLNPARSPAALLPTESADPHRAAVHRGKHRATPRRRYRPELPACPAPTGGKDARPRGTSRLPAANAALGAVTRPALAVHPVRRRRAVVASLAGTTVLASGLVLGAQIGFFPTMPFRGAEATASPTPATTARGAGYPVPKPSVSSLHSEAPPAQRGAKRTGESSTPSPSHSATSTPGPSFSSQSSPPVLPAPSRMKEGTPTPTPSPGESPSPTQPETPGPSQSPSPTADDRGTDSRADDRSPQMTASGGAAPSRTGSPGETESPESRSAGDAAPTDETGSATPTEDVGLDLGAVSLNVNVPDDETT